MTSATTTLTARQMQALAMFHKGRTSEGLLIMGRTATLTKAEAKPLIAKGLLSPEFRTLQFGIKEWTLTEEGKAAFSRLRLAAGRFTMVEG